MQKDGSDAARSNVGESSDSPAAGDSLAEWLDKLAIRDLLERYMRYNDDGAADRIAELFDTDASLQVVGRIVVGREAIRSFFRGDRSQDPAHWASPGRLFTQPRSVHLMANPVIDVAGDEATAESDFQVVRRNETGRASIALVGRYRDRLRRRDDGTWVITCRTGVSVARPGDEDTDAEWQRALASMDAETRASVRE